MTGPVIKTARHELRPMVHSDAEPVTALLNNLAVSRWLTVVPYPYTVADADWFIAENLAGRVLSWSIYADDTLIGNVGGGAALGYWLGEPYWGRGYGTEAAKAARDDHFENTDASAIHSEYFLGNAASAKILTKIGMIPTDIATTPCAALGTQVQAQRMKLTRDRWEAIRYD